MFPVNNNTPSSVKRAQKELQARYGRSQDLVPFIGVYKDVLIMRDYALVGGIALRGESDTLRPAEEVEQKRLAIAMMFSKIMHDYQIFIGCRPQRFDEIRAGFDADYHLWSEVLAFVQRLHEQIPIYFAKAWDYICAHAGQGEHEADEILEIASTKISADDLAKELWGAVGNPPYTGPGELMRTISHITRPIFIARWGTFDEKRREELITGVQNRLKASMDVLQKYIGLIVEHASYYEQQLVLYGPPLHYLAIIVPERPFLPKRSNSVVLPSDQETEAMYIKLRQKMDVIVEQVRSHFEARIMSKDDLINIYSALYQHGMMWRAG